MMSEQEQAECAALAKSLADVVGLVEHAAGMGEHVIFNAFMSAACAYAASKGRSPAEVRAVLHRLGDGLLLAGVTPRSGAN
jgi:hypothetical protein